MQITDQAHGAKPHFGRKADWRKAGLLTALAIFSLLPVARVSASEPTDRMPQAQAAGAPFAKPTLLPAPNLHTPESTVRADVAPWPQTAGAPTATLESPCLLPPIAAPQLLEMSSGKSEFSTLSSLQDALTQSQPSQVEDVQLLSHQLAQEETVAAGAPAAGEAAQFGEAPPETQNLFLRRQAVLLQPGQSQFDVGVTYTLIEQDFPVITSTAPVQAARGEFRQRTLQTPLAVRYGWSRDVQLFAATSFGWMNTEIGVLGNDDSTDDGGMGDTTFGASFLLFERYRNNPDIILTLSGKAPTGDSAAPLITAPLEGQLGNGMWGIGGDLLFIQTVDPLVVFWGGGVHYLFEREFQGVDVQPGLQINYNFGMGFSVNERITLSSALLGSYVTDYYIDGQQLDGSAQELIRMRFAMTIAQKKRIVEPFAEIGATDDAPASRFGIIFTY